MCGNDVTGEWLTQQLCDVLCASPPVVVDSLILEHDSNSFSHDEALSTPPPSSHLPHPKSDLLMLEVKRK